MPTRRRLFGCTICAAIGLGSTAAQAQQPTGITRTILQRTDHPGDRHITLLVRVEVEPNALVARHTHPGIETGYAIEGDSIMRVDGQPERPIGPGDHYLIPTGVPHEVRNGPRKTTIIATFVVEKDKPLASPA